MKWFKKPITLHFYTYMQHAYDHAKPKPSGYFMPQWWKTLDRTPRKLASLEGDSKEKVNMRNCYGMTSMYQHGLIIPMWCDFQVDIGEIGLDFTYWVSADGQTMVDNHPPSQHNSFWHPDKYAHLKLVSPWFAVCDEVVPFFWLDCGWNRNTQDEYSIPQAIVEYKYQGTTNVNVLFHRKPQKYSCFIRHGEPLVQIVPLSDRPLKIKTHLVSEPEFARLKAKTLSHVTFTNTYKYIRQLKENR